MPFLSVILKFITGPIAGPLFGVAFLATAASWGVDHFVQRAEINRLTAERDQLRTDIFAEGTGYRDRLGQCQTNAEGLKAGLATVAADIKNLADATKAGQDETRRLMADAAAVTRTVRTNTTRLLATPATAPPGTIEACRAFEKIIRTGAP